MPDKNSYPRLISRQDVLDIYGMTSPQLTAWINRGDLPSAILGSRKFDRDAIDAAFDRISNLNTPLNNPEEYENEKRRKVIDARLALWAEKPDLQSRHEAALRYLLQESQVPQDTSWMKGVSDPSMDQLIAMKLVEEAEPTARGKRRFRITKAGEQHLKQIDEWNESWEKRDVYR